MTLILSECSLQVCGTICLPVILFCSFVLIFFTTICLPVDIFGSFVLTFLQNYLFSSGYYFFVVVVPLFSYFCVTICLPVLVFVPLF